MYLTLDQMDLELSDAPSATGLAHPASARGCLMLCVGRGKGMGCTDRIICGAVVGLWKWTVGAL